MIFRPEIRYQNRSAAPYDALQETVVGNERIGSEEFSAKASFNKRPHALKITNSGLAIFSRFNIAYTFGVYFIDQGSFKNQLASEGILMACIAFANTVMDIDTTHLANRKTIKRSCSTLRRIRHLVIVHKNGKYGGIKRRPLFIGAVVFSITILFFGLPSPGTRLWFISMHSTILERNDGFPTLFGHLQFQ